MPAVILLGNGGGSGMNGGGTNVVLQNTFTSGSLVSSPGPTFTLTRATASTTQDFEGLIRSIASGEARFWKLRRIQNLYPASAVATTQSITVVAGSYILSGSGTGTITLSGTGSGTLSPGGASTRKQLAFTPTAGTCTFTVAGSITNVQLELTAGSTIQIASTYRDSATSYGAGVNAVSYENTANGNSVDGSNVVTDATGAPLTLTAAGLSVFQSYTNLALQSEDFTTTWGTGQLTVSANSTAAPNGLTTADKLQEDNTTNFHGLSQSITKAASAITYEFLGYFKQSERTWVFMQGANGANGVRAWFNLGTGALGSTTTFGSGYSVVSRKIAAVANGFYECRFVLTTDTTTTISPFIGVSTGDTVVSYAGTTGSGIFAWGAQLTTVPDAPYIATTTVAVTVNADTILQNPFTADAAYTLYGKGIKNSVSQSQPNLINLGDGTTNNTASVNGVDTRGALISVTGGVTQAAISGGTWAVGTQGKVAGRFAVNDFAVSLNGAAVVTDTSGTLATVTQMNVGSREGTIGIWNGVLQEIRYYNRGLTDAELQTLTT